MDYGEKILEKSISKATSSKECSPDPKHARKAIEESHDSVFFKLIKRRPNDSDPIVCFKGLLMTHGLLRLGKYSCLTAARSYLDWYESLQRVWSNKTKHLKGYGSSITHYCKFIIMKIKFHEKCPLFDGRFSIDFYNNITSNNQNVISLDKISKYHNQLSELQSTLLKLYSKIREAGFIHGQNELRGTAIIQLLLESSAAFSAQSNLIQSFEKLLPDIIGDNETKMITQLDQEIENVYSQLRNFYKESSSISFVVRNISLPLCDLIPKDIPKIKKRTSPQPTGIHQQQQQQQRQQQQQQQQILSSSGSTIIPNQSQYQSNPQPIYNNNFNNTMTIENSFGFYSSASSSPTPSPSIPHNQPPPNSPHLARSHSPTHSPNVPTFNQYYQSHQMQKSQSPVPNRLSESGDSNPIPNDTLTRRGRSQTSAGITNRNNRRTVAISKLPPIEAESFLERTSSSSKMDMMKNSPLDLSSSLYDQYGDINLRVDSLSSKREQITQLLSQPTIKSISKDVNPETVLLTNNTKSTLEQFLSIANSVSSNPHDPLIQTVQSLQLSVQSLIVSLTSDFHISDELCNWIQLSNQINLNEERPFSSNNNNYFNQPFPQNV